MLSAVLCMSRCGSARRKASFARCSPASCCVVLSVRHPQACSRLARTLDGLVARSRRVIQSRRHARSLERILGLHPLSSRLPVSARLNRDCVLPVVLVNSVCQTVTYCRSFVTCPVLGNALDRRTGCPCAQRSAARAPAGTTHACATGMGRAAFTHLHHGTVARRCGSSSCAHRLVRVRSSCVLSSHLTRRRHCLQYELTSEPESCPVLTRTFVAGCYECGIQQSWSLSLVSSGKLDGAWRAQVDQHLKHRKHVCCQRPSCPKTAYPTLALKLFTRYDSRARQADLWLHQLALSGTNFTDQAPGHES